ncbi:MAG: glutamate decarboxylase [Methanobacteriota archaeon]|nr:MAG: glutamate decarboxylase [Euryarchaeota archaeon]HIG19236.1 glutamate decarboxylase [Candidatus Poseidoniales archaeon]
MADDSDVLSDFDERLLQGVFARVWRYLGESADSTLPVTTSKSPQELKNKLELAVGRTGIDVDTMLSDIDDYLDESVKTSHPHFMNPLWGGTNVASLAGEFITALTNTSMYTFELAPMATLIEKEMVDTMLKLVGYKAGEGIFTTGGSNGNLLGLLCARDRKFPDAQRVGLGGKQLVAFISEDAHYSTVMAANVLGIGLDNLIAIPTDEYGAMIPEILQDVIGAEKRAGNFPFCVIATAGTTVRGGVDPMVELAEICHQEKLWLHVDAAWGGATLLSPKTRSLLHGIDLADSICWDPHKMMGVHLCCSVFLVKNSGTLGKVCVHTEKAHYLLLEGGTNVDLGHMSLQCGRRVDALKLWLAWRAKGNEGWATQIERYFSLAEYLVTKVKEHTRLELVVEPSMTNVCIRYVGYGINEAREDSITMGIRNELISTGRFMVSSSQIDGRPILRAVITNPRVDEKVIDELISSIVEIGGSLASQ